MREREGEGEVNACWWTKWRPCNQVDRLICIVYSPAACFSWAHFLLGELVSLDRDWRTAINGAIQIGNSKAAASCRLQLDALLSLQIERRLLERRLLSPSRWALIKLGWSSSLLDIGSSSERGSGLRQGASCSLHRCRHLFSKTGVSFGLKFETLVGVCPSVGSVWNAKRDS